MSFLFDSWAQSALTFHDGRLGVDITEVPASGDDGPSIMANDGLSAGKEYAPVLVTPPANATYFFLYDNGAFEYEGPGDVFTYQLYEDGVAVGSPTSVSVSFGVESRIDAVEATDAVTMAGIMAVVAVAALTEEADIIVATGISHEAPAGDIDAAEAGDVVVLVGSVSGGRAISVQH